MADTFTYEEAAGPVGGKFSYEEAAKKPEKDFSGYDVPYAAPPPLPMENAPGVHRGTILPFASDDQGKLVTTPGGWPRLYTPEILRSPIRGAVAGGQEALGERPVNDPSVRADINAAATLGAGSSPVSAVRAVSPPPEPMRPLYELVSRITGEDISKNTGALRIVKRLEQDQSAGGPTAQDMIDLINATPEKPMTLADVGGENALALAGKVTRAPGPSRQTMTKALNDRDMGAGARLSGDVNAGIGAGSSYDAATTLGDARRTAAAPAYDKAYQHPAINPDAMKQDGDIGSLLPRPSMRAGMANARKIAAEEGRDMNVLGIDLDEQGEPFFTKVPSWQTLDYVKRGVDNVVEQYRDKVTGKLVLDTYGRAAEETRHNFRSVLRDLNPDYGKALDTYSGPSTSLDALRAGQDFLRQRPEEIIRRMATLGSGDKEFYKIGAADALRTALAKKGIAADETRAIIKSQYMRDQLRPLFNDDASYDRFVKSVEAEGRMFGTKNSILGNSKTAAREIEDQSPELQTLGNASRTVKSVAEGSWMRAMAHGMETVRSFGQTKDPAINAEIARFLSTDLSDANAQGRMKALKTMLDAIGPAEPPRSQYAPPGYRGAVPFMVIHPSPLDGATAGDQSDPTLSGATNGITQ